jgi:hypothetical protein
MSITRPPGRTSRRTITAIVVAASIVILAIAILANSAIGPTKTTTISLVTTSLVTTSADTTPITFGLPPVGIYIHIVTDSGQPLNGTSIEIWYMQRVTAWAFTTNATGWVNYPIEMVGQYNFILPPSSPNFNILEKANEVTYATVALPSDNLTVEYFPLR